MKTIITSALLLLFTVAAAQKPETVYSVAKVAKSYDWFVKQAELWKNETEKKPKNEEAWFNYFKACRMAKISYRTPTNWSAEKWRANKPFLLEGNDILELIEKNIPNTFVSNYTKWYNGGSTPENFPYLKKAHEMAPERPEPLDGFVVYYETHGDKNRRKEFNQKWFELNDISSGLMYYNYNVLKSIEPGSILLTGGDNDTFPAWMLQDINGVANDVHVLNISLLLIDEYRESVFRELKLPALKLNTQPGVPPKTPKLILEHIINNQPEGKNIYLSMAIWKGNYEAFDSNIYVIGNVLQFSKQKINNIALLEKNFNTNYLLDYIKIAGFNDISRGLVERININYLPGLTQLFNHYKETNQPEKSKKIKELALLIASKGGGYWAEKANETFR